MEADENIYITKRQFYELMKQRDERDVKATFNGLIAGMLTGSIIALIGYVIGFFS